MYMPGRRVSRAFARSMTTMVALSGHLAVLYALGYERPTKITVGDPPAAIAVELASVAKDHGGAGAQQPMPMDDRNSIDAVPPEQIGVATEQPQQPQGPPVANLAEPAQAVPVPVPVERPPQPKKPATQHRQAPAAKRIAPPLVLADRSDPSATSDSSAVDMMGTAGTGAAPADVPSNWKARLLAHLDRYKRYPDAARARREEGTAFLSFRMDREGHVLGYALVRSSGHAALDEEVLAMVERAVPLPPVPPEVREDILQLVDPVRFRM